MEWIFGDGHGGFGKLDMDDGGGMVGVLDGEDTCLTHAELKETNLLAGETSRPRSIMEVHVRNPTSECQKTTTWEEQNLVIGCKGRVARAQSSLAKNDPADRQPSA